MYRSLRNFAFAIAILTAPAMADEWPESLKKAIVEPSNQATYSYKLRVESSGETAGVSFEALIDPSRPLGERIEILSPGFESADTVEFLQFMEEHAPASIWCSWVASQIPKNVVVVEESADTLVIRFRPIAGKDATKRERKLFKKLEGQLVIDKNTMTVQSYRLHNRRPIGIIMFVAKIRTFLSELECELAPNGYSYQSKQKIRVEVGVLGQRTVSTITTLISDLAPVHMSDTSPERAF